jgi:hypothetical protein
MAKSREYKADTPMTKLLQKHVPDNVAAFGRLLERYVREVDHIYEGFGGLGNQTRWLKERYACYDHEVWDTDDDCVSALRDINGIRVHKGDFFEATLSIKPTPKSLVCVDYNNFTMNPDNVKRLAPIFETGYKWLIGPDLARGKLHLNWDRTYKMERCDYDDYVKEFSRRTEEQFGMKALGYEKAPRSITYILWEKI